MSKCIANKPCKNCPWKKSSAAGGKDIANFDMGMMRNLSSTSPARGRTNDDFRNLFACHESLESKEYVCAGYAARDGIHNIRLRLYALQHNFSLQTVVQNAEKHELYDNFYQMLDAYEQANSIKS
ncbi:hypothetical protein A1QO_02525 [Vibrio genomosp. F10 str. ZF-129]|uniref:Uncharacterized protein n=1 Tax=Vibrio genomosp. F10 str. ZF-129 TaxID=1187848 RepID=A0A1E5BK93_9VIBR|nr:DUF6283 family protein [Vibrio genomosp. F10]OEE38272.1 hypothetical protein A1QO_02525 [Vibrio genomosp. F10 str. ZF-129]